jgi:thioesterase domain-containing protein
MPFYAFDAKEPHEVDVRTHSIPAVAAAYIAEMKQRQPVGPYDIGGVCWAALVGLEMAHQLRAAGDEVRILALFDPNPVGPASYERFFREDVRHRLRQVRSAGFKEGAGLLWSVFRDLERRVRAPLGLIRPARATRQWTATEWHALYGTPEGVALRDKILRDYQPLPYPGPLTVFLAAQNQCGANDIRRSDWQRLAHGECREIAIDGEHMTWTKRPAVTRLAAALLDVLDEVRSRKTSVEINPPVAV